MHRHRLPTARQPRNEGRLRDVVRHGDADPAQGLDALGDGIDELALLGEVLVVEQMQLIEGGARHLPMMFLVHVAQRHDVGDELVQVVDARLAHVLGQRDGQPGERPERLGLVVRLSGEGSDAIENIARLRVHMGHGIAPSR